MDFHIKVKKLRIDFGYSQRYVANMLEVRLSAYQKYEYGTARPNYEKLVILANLYNVSVDYLLNN